MRRHSPSSGCPCASSARRRRSLLGLRVPSRTGCGDETVGVQRQHTALREIQLERLEGQAAHPQRGTVREVGERDGAVGIDDRGRGMARARHGALPAHRVVHHVQTAGADRLHPARTVVGSGALLPGGAADHVVEVGEYFLRGQVQVGEGLYGGPQPPHGRSAVDAVTGDLAHHQGDPGSGQGNHVVPVPGETGQFVGGPVDGGDLHRVLVGEAVGEEVALEDQGRVALAGVPAGVVDAEGGPAHELLGQAQIVLVEGVLAAAPEERGDAQGDAAGPDGHDHHAVQPEIEEGGGPAPGGTRGPLLGQRVQPFLSPGLAVGERSDRGDPAT